MNFENHRCQTWGPFLERPANFSGPEKLFYVCRVCNQDQSFNNFENDALKQSVNEAKLTRLWARMFATIQVVLISKFSFGREKLSGLSRNGSCHWGRGISQGYYRHDHGYFHRIKNENRTKRNPLLFNCPPTNCTYPDPATWKLSQSPTRGCCRASANFRNWSHEWCSVFLTLFKNTTCLFKYSYNLRLCS